MTRFALKGLLGRKLRTALTALAIVLGVAMVSGTYVLTDSIDSAFDAIFTDVRESLDRVVVTGKSAFDLSEGSGATATAVRRERARHGPRRRRRRGGGGQRRQRLDDADRPRRQGDRLRRRAQPRLRDRERRLALQPARARVRPLAGAERGRDRQRRRREEGLRDRPDGSASRPRGRSSRCASPGSSSSPPRSRSAARRWRASTCRPRSGCSRRRASSTRSRSRRSPASRDTELIENIEAVLPPSTQALSGQQQAVEDASDTNEFISFLQGFLLAFAGIALFVGSFVIANSLSITIAQRTREFATIRTLGGSRRQVLTSIVIEALVVGVVASVIGLFSGLLLGEGPLQPLRRGRLHAPEPRPPARDEDGRRRAARRHRRHAAREPAPGDPRHARAADRGRARGRDAARVALRPLPHARVAAHDRARLRLARVRALRQRARDDADPDLDGPRRPADLHRRLALRRAARPPARARCSASRRRRSAAPPAGSPATTRAGTRSAPRRPRRR